ncbi:MFS transporter [Phaeobacter gallaeciensis]|uniref:MFS transporter n=1 Tax=Phaeobacter gallaeciensis TaxID=60890 RepID=UPI00237FB138|nr:MFS transporter [Phaeobacter gallaeciensis]MDE4305450.1 MFS transporter [Phaeobacter gallaeciensis]MDE4309798.1 MFS transporter [Phaeobacter gallaeciensis]MDE4314255.1 MFS transporter [Phaeobacter gallaeciensis]MDE4318902.1 MFS transporter [Phaeobacter gallaeciensis]MDE4323064.1 MFS transporter [Phaeobacter gallaeciensis]
MQAGLILLCLAYVLSQFFRAFLAVLTGVLGTDLGVKPDDLAFASGMWFLAFAAMQLPVGWALDHIGPRRSAAVLLLLGGGGGALVFALASGPFHIAVAMFLIGVGCSPVLMASYFIFAQTYPPVRFATLAALMLGVGSVGNLVASYPTALAVDLVGWRATLVGLAVVSASVAAGIWLTVKDPPKSHTEVEGSVLDLLKMPVLWAIFPIMLVSYAPVAAIRGLWIGPYFSDVYGMETGQIGLITLIMGVAMILGTFVYGPLDRMLGTRKWVIWGGSMAVVLGLVALIVLSGAPVWMPVALMAGIGFFGASFPVVIAHGRAFVPAHLVGRGVTLLNFFGIGGVGLMQFASGRIHAEMAQGSDPAAPYIALFGFFAASLLLGCVIYLFSRDSLD